MNIMNETEGYAMKQSTAKRCLPIRIFQFYADGFRNMTVGKTLWAIILVKLFIMFAILKLFFFPDFLKSKSDNEEGKADYVRSELVKRNNPDARN